MSTFIRTDLANYQALVQGIDEQGSPRQVVLNSQQWHAVNGLSAIKVAEEEFDAALKDFYAPLREAESKLKDALTETQEDPDFHLVIQEEVESTAGARREVIRLEKDTVILNLIDKGETDRLIWVGDTIAIKARSTALPVRPTEVPGGWGQAQAASTEVPF